MENYFGALKPGYRANFFVASGPVFDTIKNGCPLDRRQKHDIVSTNKVNIDGYYTLMQLAPITS